MQAQELAPAAERARWSHSGQFVVSAVPPKRQTSRLISNLETNREYVRLDPTLVPVSGERIKQNLSRELGLYGPWQGKIFLSLYPASAGDDPVVITSGQFRDGWQYRVEMPDLIDRLRFVRAIVQVLLLETANRTATDHSAEIPAWLSEGLSQKILLSSEMEIILPPPGPAGTGFRIATQVVNSRKEDPMRVVHKQLCAAPPLTFQELSWPAAEHLEGPMAATYRSSSHFFVNELLQLADGSRCLRVMLAELGQHYNWQFAFLKAFRAHFQRPLDIEKWWALHLEHFTGRQLAQTWAADESWRKLDELVRSTVQIRTGTNDLPLRAELKLQTIVQEWDPPHQEQALRDKMRELEMLRLRLAPELVSLADEYHRTLANYLQARDQGRFLSGRKGARRAATEQAVRQLDELDTRRIEARLKAEAGAIQANSAPARP